MFVQQIPSFFKNNMHKFWNKLKESVKFSTNSSIKEEKVTEFLDLLLKVLTTIGLYKLSDGSRQSS